MKLDLPTEHGFGRPYVSKGPGGFTMYYSIRKRHPAAYRLGLAGSHDGLVWQRRDADLNLDVTPGDEATTWDAHSVEYSAELVTGAKTWLLYNGNDFGGSGFGIAERT